MLPLDTFRWEDFGEAELSGLGCGRPGGLLRRNGSEHWDINESEHDGSYIELREGSTIVRHDSILVSLQMGSGRSNVYGESTRRFACHSVQNVAQAGSPSYLVG